MSPLLDMSLVKSWLRLEEEYTEEDAILELLILNAECYMRDSINNYDLKMENERNKAKARFIGLMLIVDWYEKRDLTGIVSDKIRYSFSSILLQLQTGGEV